jgi:SanA protein
MEDTFIDSPSLTKTGSTTSTGMGCLLALLIIFAILLTPLLWRRAVSWYYEQQIHPITSVSAERVAVVFGAAVYRDGRLSSILRDRMDTAIALYESGKVEKILVSGDNQSAFYDEPGAMKAYAVQRGVPEEDIHADHGGRRTYDTCYRARDIFQLQRAILVTQAFHLPRALFTCRQLGLDVQGVSADMRPYRSMRWYEFRETFATLNALWDVVRKEPPPVLGEPISLD